MKKVAVIGSGSWGTALSTLLASTSDSVVIWSRESDIADSITTEHFNCRHLSTAKLPENIFSTTSQEQALTDSDAIVLAAPSAFLRSVCAACVPFINSDVDVLVLSKGMEANSHKLMHEVAADELGNQSRIAVLSGPNHAEEVIKQGISAAVVASENVEVAKRFQALLSRPYFRTYISSDVRGVEACAAAKNVVAIACGIAAGMGNGDNTLAALMTRGLAELGRVVCAIGGDPMTCMGLAGMGDLVATCTSKHSRNRTFGEALVAGKTLESYQADTGMVVEGAQAVIGLYELGQQMNIEMPITSAVHAVLYEGASLKDITTRLTNRLPNEEFYGMTR
ncbi:MAG: NAD(P)-dependent glycerol-3-phosphate dehydrogenase [Atopobiaceae bacterium]|nr:NAD(P)-dependent glycerol-3-phosphate dehydrogenase [Atopobiaceae bacterium]